MRPELFRLFDVGFPSYFVLLLSGFLFATTLGVLWARRIGLNPDVIVDLPSFKVPATGLVQYQNQVIDNPFKENTWLKAIAMKPGDRRVPEG